MLAKYGGDAVLRFNLSTSYEEQALAEAADTLFLDVWEFTNNWADIRLREDDVCYHYPTANILNDSDISWIPNRSYILHNSDLWENRLYPNRPKNVLTGLGTITPWVTAQITPKSIFESYARPGKDDLPILPLHYLRRAIITLGPCRSFHTCIEGVQWG